MLSVRSVEYGLYAIDRSVLKGPTVLKIIVIRCSAASGRRDGLDLIVYVVCRRELSGYSSQVSVTVVGISAASDPVRRRVDRHMH